MSGRDAAEKRRCEGRGNRHGGTVAGSAVAALVVVARLWITARRYTPVDGRTGVKLPTEGAEMPISGLGGVIAGGDVSVVHATVAPSERALEEPLMTQNGPYPGPPSQPWSGGGSHEPYTEPADPWGDHPTSAAAGSAWGGHPTSMPPAAESSIGYPPPQTYGAPAWSQPPPPPPPPKRRNTPIVALVVVLGLLICGGLGTTAWLLNERDDVTGRGPAPASLPATVPATDDVADPQPRSSADARFVAKGQCVRNQGTADRPEMQIVNCANGTYEVLKRVDGRTTGEADAEAKCAKVANYTKWYFYDSELDSLDFVLCLRDR